MKSRKKTEPPRFFEREERKPPLHDLKLSHGKWECSRCDYVLGESETGRMPDCEGKYLPKTLEKES